jgi:hypothetical protein
MFYPGPPGTGKTYLGLKLVQTILERRKLYNIKDEGPIFVVCLTNHALDQFLEGMLEFTTNMLRVGSRCQNPALEQFTVREVQRRLAGTRAVPSQMFQMQGDINIRMRSIESQVARHKMTRDGLTGGYGVLNRAAIVQVDHEVVLPENFDASAWLGLAGDRPPEFSKRFVKQVLEHEKRYVLER